MRRDQALARERWFAELRFEKKEAVLFELEVLLKSFACFQNPRNHAGAASSVPLAAHNFRRELFVVDAGIERVSQNVRRLLGDGERAYVFSRFLETLVSSDDQRNRLLQNQVSQYTPEESLFAFRSAFASFSEMSGGLLELDRIPHRVFRSLLSTITREVGRNEHFNSLATLEFRPEFDRIRVVSVLTVLTKTPDPAQRTIALTLLSLLRLIRYLDLLDEYAKRSETEPLTHLVVSVLLSEGRALAHTLETQSADALAGAFEHAISNVSAEAMLRTSGDLFETADHLYGLSQVLRSVGQTLRLELELAVSDVPSPWERSARGSLGPKMMVGAASLRAICHHAITSLCHEISPETPMSDLASKERLSLEASQRLRRDIWSFRQVLRAFLLKSEEAFVGIKSWDSVRSFRFVRDFLQHFQAIGYQLARRSDYPRFDRFIQSVARLSEIDLLDAAELRRVTDECREFNNYLRTLFDAVCQRTELEPHPFNRDKAVEHLRAYLGV